MIADRKILQMKYARIVEIFAKRMHISNDKALEIFYDSDTYTLISEARHKEVYRAIQNLT